jgi:magnesium transporter
MLEKLKANIRMKMGRHQSDEATTSLKESHPHDVAELMEGMNKEDGLEIIRSLDTEDAGKVLEYLSPAYQEKMLKSLEPSEAAVILNEMAPDDRTELLENFRDKVDISEILGLMSPEESAVTQSLLDYPENSVGRIMTTDYLAVKEDWTAQQVLDYLRNNSPRVEWLEMIFVVDNDNKLIDDIPLHEFVLAPTTHKVSQLMDHNFTFLKDLDREEDAAEVFQDYDRTAIPVVKEDMTMVGIVTVDDIMDVIKEKNTEEIQKFGGVEALDYPYASTSIVKLVSKRASWLVILFLGEMMTSNVMKHFEGELARVLVLSTFIPLVLSTGGNSGSQAATLIIRSLALGELTLKSWWFVMKREAISGLMLGGILGLLGFIRVAIWAYVFPLDYGVHWMKIGFTVGFSIVGIVLWGTLSGSLLPFMLKKLGLDPATSSAPFVATLVDVTALIIFFMMAVLFLKGTLL